MTVIARDDAGASALAEEYEHEAVPIARRKPLGSVAAIWFGFPMILTNAVFGGIKPIISGSRRPSAPCCAATPCSASTWAP